MDPKDIILTKGESSDQCNAKYYRKVANVVSKERKC